MTERPRRDRRPRGLLFLLFASGAALADDAGFLRCRGIVDPVARLACYDALPLPAAPSKVEAAPPVAPPQPTPLQQQQQFGLPAPQPAAPQTAQQFGLPPPPQPSAELDTIESTIPGHFDGWHANSRIRLANGQVWQVVDATSRIMDVTDPKVTIRRGLLSAFYLEFEGTNQTARVKRLQ